MLVPQVVFQHGIDHPADGQLLCRAVKTTQSGKEGSKCSRRSRQAQRAHSGLQNKKRPDLSSAVVTGRIVGVRTCSSGLMVEMARSFKLETRRIDAAESCPLHAPLSSPSNTLQPKTQRLAAYLQHVAKELTGV